MSFPIQGNTLNRYLIPIPVAAHIGSPLVAAPSITPSDGFWSREFDRILLTSTDNSAVYNYDGVRHTIAHHQTSGLAVGRQASFNPAGDRIAGIDTNTLRVLAYDRTSGLLSSDISLVDSVNFNVARWCSWSPDGGFIAVANNDSATNAPVLTVVRYTRSPAALAVVATFVHGDFGFGRECVNWGANNIITASGVHGFWGLTFDSALNTLTRFTNITGTFRLELMAANPTGEFISGFDPDNFIRVHSFRYTPSPHLLTFIHTLSLPAINFGAINGKMEWDSNSRNLVLSGNTATGAQHAAILRFDPVGLSVTHAANLFIGTVNGNLMKPIFNPIHGVIARIQSHVDTPLILHPWASHINT